MIATFGGERNILVFYNIQQLLDTLLYTTSNFSLLVSFTVLTQWRKPAQKMMPISLPDNCEVLKPLHGRGASSREPVQFFFPYCGLNSRP
jgi:hypothetical protein